MDPRVAKLLEEQGIRDLEQMCKDLGLSYQIQKWEMAERIVATQVRMKRGLLRSFADISGGAS